MVIGIVITKSQSSNRTLRLLEYVLQDNKPFKSLEPTSTQIIELCALIKPVWDCSDQSRIQKWSIQII